MIAYDVRLAIAEPRRGVSRPLWVALAGVATLALLLLRATDSFVHPQFWAEDGAIFFAQQHELGAGAILRPYAGYLHLLPRLTAYVASVFPATRAPDIYAFCYLLIAVWTTVTIASAALPLAPLYAACLFSPPHSGEIFGTITNVQWVTAAALPLLAASDTRPGVFARGNDIAFAAAAGLTGPFAILSLPAFAAASGDRATATQSYSCV